MDPNEKQLQSAGICHRLFWYIMKTLATQAFKPVTLGGPRILGKPTQKPISSVTGHVVRGSQSRGSTGRDEDSESLASIDVEDGLGGNHEEITVEMMREHGPKPLKKTVSIKDEPEIIFMGNKRRKAMTERQISNVEKEKERELRPLRSILKVGSSLGEISNAKPIRNATMIMN